MRQIKKIILLAAFVFVANVINAQPPTPTPKPTSPQTQGINRTKAVPVGTSSAMLVVFCTVYAMYKVRKNKKSDDFK